MLERIGIDATVAISIGKVVERNGKRLPEKDDEFTVTSQVQSLGNLVNHPIDETLRKAPGAKLRSIPVRLLFDDPDLNLRANYQPVSDRVTHRPCVSAMRTAGASRPLACRRYLALTGSLSTSPWGYLQTLWPSERSHRR